MREYLPGIAGNGELCRRLGRDIENGAFSHAYILSSPRGGGKELLATELIAALACEHRTDQGHALPCGTCAACRKIKGGHSPDVTHIRRAEGKATLGVDDVRRLRADVSTVPNDLSFKVYILHDAHTMTVQAQNALLLTLEEPPQFVRFLLLADDPSVLLETIRSRAPILRMLPVSPEETKAFLLSPLREPRISRAAAGLQESAPEELDAILRAAHGSIGRAIELLDPAERAPVLESRAAIHQLCRLLAKRTSPQDVLLALLAFGKGREDVVSRLLLLQEALRDLLAALYSDEPPLLFFTDAEAALELASAFTARRLLSALENISLSLEALAANGNVRLALFELFGKLTV